MSFSSNSTRTKLQPPVYKPNIPDHLLHTVDEKDKFILMELDRNKQYMEWVVNTAIEQHDNNENLKDYVEKISERVSKIENARPANWSPCPSIIETRAKIEELETWKTSITAKWGTLGFIGGLIVISITSFITTILHKMIGN